jgi:hypothetical protein
MVVGYNLPFFQVKIKSRTYIYVLGEIHSSHNNVVIFKVNRVIKMYNVVGHSAVKVTTLNHEKHT